MRPDMPETTPEEEDSEPVAPLIDQAETRRVKLKNGIEPGFEPDFDDFFIPKIPKNYKLTRGMNKFWKFDLKEGDKKPALQCRPLQRRGS